MSTAIANGYVDSQIWTPPSFRAALPDANPNAQIIVPGVRRASPLREYVVRSNQAFWGNYNRKLAALPTPIDDLDRELGTDVLRKMMLDPQINSSIYLAAVATMSRGMRIKPRVTDKLDPRYEDALFMMGFIEDNLAGLEHSTTELLVDMIVGSLVVGNCVAEQNYYLKEGGKHDGKLMLKNLKTKPPEVYAFLTDRFGNVPALAVPGPKGSVGIPPMVLADSQANLVLSGETVLLGSGWRAVPLAKFAVLANRKRYGDPRGYSALRPAYGAWYSLMRLWPEYIKYLVQFASPSIVGTLPEKAFPEYNPDTGETEDPLDVLYYELQNFANGSFMALRYGSVVDLKWSQGDGTAFTQAINLLNHQMVKAILHQLLATEEGKHQARAASSTHQDVLNMMVRGLKNSVVSMVQRQIFRQLILLNFGENAADTLTPYLSLGDIAQEDKSDMVKAYSAGGYVLGPTQFPAIDAELELEVRSIEQAQTDYETTNPTPVAVGGEGDSSGGSGGGSGGGDTKPKKKQDGKPQQSTKPKRDRRDGDGDGLINEKKALWESATEWVSGLFNHERDVTLEDDE
jgi:hypothetical protein